MKKFLALGCIVFMLGSCTTPKAFTLEAIQKLQPKEETKTIIATLASDAFKGRSSDTDGYENAATYAERYLSENGIQPFFNTGYRDTVSLNGNISANVVGLIGKPDIKRPHILIGAHLDHLGLTGDTTDPIFNGANDNASGSTAVLQIAKVLNSFAFEQNIVVALFAEEERGLVGAEQLAQRLKEEGVLLKYMINFEMIGKTLTTGENKVYITGYHKSNFAQEMNALAANEFIQFLPTAESFNLFKRSDNYAFYEVFKVPSHTLSTFDFENYQHYHKATDEVNELDLDNMNQVINTSTYLIGQLLSKNIILKNTSDTVE